MDVKLTEVQEPEDQNCLNVVPFEGEKPFLGGFRNDVTGIEYHNATSQTAPNPKFYNSFCTFACKDSQTVQLHSKSQQTTKDNFTQMTKIGCYVSCKEDKIIVPGTYLTADEEKKIYIEKLIKVQSYVRSFLAKRKVNKIREQIGQHEEWLRMQQQRRIEEKEKRILSEEFRKKNPRTPEDFTLLYNAIAKWRSEQEEQINQTTEGPERKAALYILADQEAELLRIVNKHKIIADKMNEITTVKNILKTTSTPKSWVSYDGKITKVYTPSILHAKELQDLYETLLMKGLSQHEIIDALLTLKEFVQQFYSPLSIEIIDLINREADLLIRGIGTKAIEGLHQRILTLYMQLVRTPKFNPEYGNLFKPKTQIGKKSNKFRCYCCGLSFPPDQFVYAANKVGNVVGKCLKCRQQENIAHARKEDSIYSYMLEQLKKQEKALGAENSIAYFMEESDFRYLVEVIWNAQSILSDHNNLYDLTMVRWQKDQPWTPWNCILLTHEEVDEHNRMDDILQSYVPSFIKKVKHKHVMAKNFFFQLPMLLQRTKPKVIKKVEVKKTEEALKDKKKSRVKSILNNFKSSLTAKAS